LPGQAPPPPPDDDPPFPEWAAPVAAVLTIFAPFISLIVALVMRSGEQRPRRRGFLKTWAIASGAWMCTGFVIVLLAFGCAANGASGGCQDGGLPSYTSTDNVHWTETVCENGKSVTKSVPASQVPGG
jgi:hypothetical protein